MGEQAQAESEHCWAPPDHMAVWTWACMRRPNLVPKLLSSSTFTWVKKLQLKFEFVTQNNSSERTLFHNLVVRQYTSCRLYRNNTSDISEVPLSTGSHYHSSQNTDTPQSRFHLHIRLVRWTIHSKSVANSLSSAALHSLVPEQSKDSLGSYLGTTVLFSRAPTHRNRLTPL